MKPQYQTQFGGPDDPPEKQGNCWAACIASIAEIPISEFPVPYNMEWGDYWDAVMEFLAERNLSIVRYEAKHKENESLVANWHGHVIAVGKSPNGNWDHCVVWKDGNIVHDPHPNKPGLASEPHEFEMVVML